MDLVLDTGILLAACAGKSGFSPLMGHRLHAVDLVAWEAESILHEFVWRLGRRLSVAQWPGASISDFQGAFQTLSDTLDAASSNRKVELHGFHPRLADEAWLVADRCGFAKVYDAASVALARRLGCRLVTLDARLVRSPASRLATLVGPTQI